MEKILLYYLIAMNVIAFFVYGLDKLAAKMEKWRISEKVLLGLAVLGGAIGALLGMYCFHHKTRKVKFFIGVPLILIVQAVLFIYVKFYM